MITLILGQNAIGKSYYLNKILKENIKSSIIASNINGINGLENFENREYNKERLEILEENKFIDEISVKANKISIIEADMKTGHKFESIVYLLCKEADILILDEPEYGLSAEETILLFDLITKMASTFKDVYIVSHSVKSIALLWNNNSKLYTVVTKSNSFKLEEEDKDKAYELID